VHSAVASISLLGTQVMTDHWFVTDRQTCVQ